ncbi:undecaprenyldiphospho-muramoylpentapeptide beta-N-acetylglucosaminyltransferase [Anaerotignum propionicum]|uniref:UDP-N-acetylglucosamine--N-acetylmuramyl-(pentapeptide) pyrophosphoryl-undecaprenol N-acetylglucosamine transferase n=1 Tax=Anaerotignum propionicum DSM 1682 TaxID=991789 RepID=A0A110A7L0_ANAPI|nr:undecaprenyldiphospho-muramoylpentapeptide beta-N-acetylglucosaminyltransferase [Anaerotignum propionicum]AMJ42263.1 UDP-N-acetylglucosamine--N-pyrophosphoryl-undecaprenol N-acetylglucosamine transferase [Anaerotignum propionicum DSM 1682]MEA5056819.1 undecaprenyldiphospho-muramoylpentapeptide beta-N-acetylglucosaminyltransferase [Anaerotignum propionicum]SHE55089.1 UDP-N-acetylglucosamine-N-acetylmuramylpentapeptide N-acetylglucosamine transferase [[Clostridium] propionicum DSM 1682] [Anaero
MKKIVLTGGGTAGHVTPNLALIPFLKEDGWEVIYIGSEKGIERSLIEAEGIPYYSIPTGKLRRYLSKENFSDMFRVVKGVAEAKKRIKEIKPDLVFSKGGFVAVPVVLAAKANGVPVIIHESDITPGLANKIAMPFAKVICTTFPETLGHISKQKGMHTGSPIRKELFDGNRQKGLETCGFDGNKPVLLMMGGSLGAVKLNQCLRAELPALLQKFDIIHLCGKGNLETDLLKQKGYKQFEYVSAGLADLFAAADVIVSRAGSNSICEFLALKKPHLLIPLSKNASRGDQILNAASFAKQGFARVLPEEEMTPESLMENINTLYENRYKYIEKMEKSGLSDGTKGVLSQIRKF